jgi:hypothetical protein
MDAEHELRAHSDRMLELLKRLQTLEQEKHHVPVGSPEFLDLAGEVERLSRLVFRWSGIQMQSAEHAAALVQRGEMPGTPLDSVEPRRLDVILASWREAQLRFELAKPGSDEAAQAASDVERLREEFGATQENLGSQSVQGNGRS